MRGKYPKILGEGMSHSPPHAKLFKASLNINCFSNMCVSLWACVKILNWTDQIIVFINKKNSVAFYFIICHAGLTSVRATTSGI